MYKLKKEGVIHLPSEMFIPFAEGNRHYVQYLEWLAEGNTPEPEIGEAELNAALEKSARDLRDTELTRADIMLNRVQDGETGIGTQKAWRAYRVSLRDWPSTESFPLDAPVAPDVKV
jgi:hypothetical protein